MLFATDCIKLLINFLFNLWKCKELTGSVVAGWDFQSLKAVEMRQHEAVSSTPRTRKQY
jgi:hypothetical protein